MIPTPTNTGTACHTLPSCFVRCATCRLTVRDVSVDEDGNCRRCADKKAELTPSGS